VRWPLDGNASSYIFDICNYSHYNPTAVIYPPADNKPAATDEDVSLAIVRLLNKWWRGWLKWVCVAHGIGSFRAIYHKYDM
jgi:hypothetical protein